MSPSERASLKMGRAIAIWFRMQSGESPFRSHVTIKVRRLLVLIDLIGRVPSAGMR